jgi:hypothetical protein
MKNKSKKAHPAQINYPAPFPVKIQLRIDGLTTEEKIQDCRALAIYPDGLGYAGTAVVLREGPNLRITFKGQL